MSIKKKLFKDSVIAKVKKVIMREKVNNAFSQYRVSVHSNNKIWEGSKKIITGDARAE